MFRHSTIAIAVLISGCTVGWLDLRTESKTSSGWQCPLALTVNLTSGYTTNTFGPKEEKPDRVREQEQRYRHLAEQVLRERQCVLKEGAEGEILSIEINEMQHLSALPQEWLTGLTFGLVPSWGTRPAEIRFSFSQEPRKAAYLVDDKRVNHLILFPVFWVSFFLMDKEKEFENALNDFTAGL